MFAHQSVHRILVLIAHYLGLDLTVFRRLACDNGSLSEVVFNRPGPRLQILNSQP